MAAYRCPVCEYTYDEEQGEPREGFPAGTRVERRAGRLELPGLRGARQGRLRASRRGVVEAARQSFADASRELLRDRVLDAVGELASARPWSEVTMAEIALAAGVSRQTLYNTFGSRQELAQAYVLREGDRFVAAVESAIRDAAPDARAALRGAVEIFLTAAETHPLIKAVASSDSSDEFLPLVTTRGGPLVAEVTDRLAGIIVESWPGVPRREVAGHRGLPGPARDQPRGAAGGPAGSDRERDRRRSRPLPRRGIGADQLELGRLSRAASRPRRPG